MSNLELITVRLISIPVTKKIGEFLESLGIECDSCEWNPKEEQLDERLDEDEEEE